jgi:hypothetical protein
MSRGIFARASTGDSRFRTDVNLSAQKRTGRDHHGARSEAPSFQRLHADYSFLFR